MTTKNEQAAHGVETMPEPDYSWTCFYCSNPVNRSTSGHVARIWHGTTTVPPRVSTRAFHDACLDKFKVEGGRPFNPDTTYEVMQVWDAPTGVEL